MIRVSSCACACFKRRAWSHITLSCGATLSSEQCCVHFPCNCLLEVPIVFVQMKYGFSICTQSAVWVIPHIPLKSSVALRLISVSRVSCGLYHGRACPSLTNKGEKYGRETVSSHVTQRLNLLFLKRTRDLVSVASRLIHKKRLAGIEGISSFFSNFMSLVHVVAGCTSFQIFLEFIINGTLLCNRDWCVIHTSNS